MNAPHLRLVKPEPIDLYADLREPEDDDFRGGGWWLLAGAISALLWVGIFFAFGWFS